MTLKINKTFFGRIPQYSRMTCVHILFFTFGTCDKIIPRMDLRKLLKILGPGLLMAGAAIGVSHLVQSTRAGAYYGYELIWVIILANLLKYPFFEFGTRYATVTGNSLIYGYLQIGKWAVGIFTAVTLASMFAIQGAVTIVTAGIAKYLFNSSLTIPQISAVILGTTMVILMLGHYNFLDRLIKVVIVVLAVTTIIAVVSAFGANPGEASVNPRQFLWGDRKDILFLIAFIGWMPAPLDLTVWQSLWTVAKQRQFKVRPKLGEALIDFKTGYFGTIFLAIAFLLLGALILHNSGVPLSGQGAEFASQLISMYTSSIGEWSHYVIGIAALTTMYSTTLTCIDAYPRVMRPLTEYYMPGLEKRIRDMRIVYWFWIVFVVTGTLLLMRYFASSMRFMVDFATTLSFLMAPLLAILNYKVVTDKHIPRHGRPGKWLRILSWAGIVFLSAFTVIYLIWRII
jgi:Mn2+/Fe2+ NRAMP family transporter